MKKNSVVQLTGSSLDKSIRGCLGIILTEYETSSEVGIYYPEVSGRNAFLKRYNIANTELTLIGVVKLKPV